MAGARNKDKIEVILIPDCVVELPHHFRFIASFAQKVYAGIAKGQLWMRSIVLYNRDSYHDFTNDEGTFIYDLEGLYAKRTRLELPYRRFRLYPQALKLAESIFKTHVGQRFVVLFTHGKELCTRFECKDCCHNCGSCSDYACKKRLRIEDADFFVTNQADALKKIGVKVITIGVGNNSDPIRLKCWASRDMFFSLKEYAELPVRGANTVLKLIKGTKRPLGLISTGPTTTTTTTATRVASVKAVPARGTPPLKASTTHTSRIVATATTITSRWVMTNMTSKYGGYINTLQSTTMTTHAAGQSSGNGMESYWWVIVVAAALVISLVVAVALIGAVMRRWKREKRTLDPTIHKQDSRGPTKLLNKPLGSNSYTSTGSLGYGTQPILAKDPYFVTDQTCGLTTDRFRGSSYWGTRNKQAGRKHSAATDFMPTGKASGAPTRADPTAGFASATKFRSLPMTYKKATTFRLPSKFATTQKVKVSPIGKKAGKNHGFGVNQTKQWAKKQERPYSQSTQRVLPKSYAPV